MYLPGLLTAILLVDRENYFHTRQLSAKNFVWNDEIQTRANSWVNNKLLLSSEFVYKALDALTNPNDIGRLFLS